MGEEHQLVKLVKSEHCLRFLHSHSQILANSQQVIIDSTGIVTWETCFHVSIMATHKELFTPT